MGWTPPQLHLRDVALLAGLRGPSHSVVLDKRAVAIVMAAGPFGPFTTDMRRKADEMVITSRLKFTREDGLEATLTARP